MVSPNDDPPIVDAEGRLDADLTLIERAEAAVPAHRAVFRRMARNLGWLLGGKGFQGLASLGYLGFSARALGPEAFGIFTLILTYAQSIANLISFQSWQAVIRYGSLHLAAGRRDRLARMLGLTATIDFAAAIVGAALAAIFVPVAAPLLGWSPAQQAPSALFAAVLLLSTGTTPSGILRLEDRFDLLACVEAVSPFLKLVAAGAAWYWGASVEVLLAIWAGAAVVQAIAGWGCALAILRGRIVLGAGASRAARHENDGILRFLAQTNLSSSLGQLSAIGTLAIGGVAGPVAAGGFSVANKLTKAVAKPVQTVTRVLYPEFARLVAGNDRAALSLVLRRVTLAAFGLGVGLVLLLGFGGRTMLRLLTGDGYGFAHGFVIAFAVAAAIDMWGFALEPFHNAVGRAGRVLTARASGAALYYAALFVLLPIVGPIGGALAAILNSLTVRIQLAISTARLLRRDAY